MRGETNKKYFNDGDVLYLYLNQFMLNMSGDCHMNIATSKEDAIEFGDENYIFKIKLKKQKVKTISEEKLVTITKKVIEDD